MIDNILREFIKYLKLTFLWVHAVLSVTLISSFLSSALIYLIDLSSSSKNRINLCFKMYVNIYLDY